MPRRPARCTGRCARSRRRPGSRAYRPRVDVGEAFEEEGLTLHDRQRRLRADVAESEHGRAVVTTATVLRLIVSFLAAEGSFAMAIEIRATPGVYAIERSSRVLRATLGSTEIVPPRCRRNVRSLIAMTRAPSTTSTAARSNSE